MSTGTLPTTERERAKEMVKGYEFRDEPATRPRLAALAGYTSMQDMALAMVDAYYQDPEPSTNNTVVAASAIYAACRLFDRRVAQEELASEFDISGGTISKHYQHLYPRVTRADE